MVSWKVLRVKLRAFFAMQRADRLLVCEAVAMLAVARLIVLIVPFQYVVPWLQRAPEMKCGGEVPLMRVSGAVTIAARNVFWDAVCLPQAMAAKAMLARRGQGSSF